MKPLFSEYF